MSAGPVIAVILPTHAPHPGRLRRTLNALRAQTLPASHWETLLVDNAPSTPLAAASIREDAPSNLAIVPEPILGLTSARLRGIRTARAPLLVFVDDDNVLDPGYLERAVALFAELPAAGAAGGPVTAEWEATPPAWMPPFQGLLAVHEHGPARRIARGGPGAAWPDFAPVGAGLVVRKNLAEHYASTVAAAPQRRTLDRSGNALSSGGDSDLVFTVLHGGADVVYEPALRVTHLIPVARTKPDYLARLNRGIMRSWVHVLALHGQCPWPAIPRWTVPLRAARAWLRRGAWQSPAARVRWAGDLGQFEGQADLRTG